jgi:hypothetical protein
MEKIFSAMQCPNEKKVVLATYILREEAEQWWRTTKRILEEDLTWEEFVEVFMDHFFPEFEREQRKKEFINLSQGQMVVSEYIFKFHRLERYCLGLYSNPKSRARKFVEGLRDGLRRGVISGRPGTLAEAIDCARELEADYLRTRGKEQKRNDGSQKSENKGSQWTQGNEKRSHSKGKKRKFEQ